MPLVALHPKRRRPDALPPLPSGTMPRIAPEIFRKRMLVEGYFERERVDERTSGQGKAANEGYDAFVPLIDSGIYVAVWSGARFVSCVLYTCAEFDEAKAA